MSIYRTVEFPSSAEMSPRAEPHVYLLLDVQSRPSRDTCTYIWPDVYRN
jgi:hypothetical protein